MPLHLRKSRPYRHKHLYFFSERSPSLPLHQVHALPRGQARHPGEVGQARRTQDQDLRFHLEPGEIFNYITLNWQQPIRCKNIPLWYICGDVLRLHSMKINIILNDEVSALLA